MVRGFYIDGNGTLWAATEGGLSRIKDGRVLTLTSQNGLPCNTVHWMMEDDAHSVWLYLACGLVRIGRSELDAWASHPKQTIQATVFDSSDGVSSHRFTGGYSSVVAKSADGKLWFVRLGGVSVIDPHHLAVQRASAAGAHRASHCRRQDLRRDERAAAAAARPQSRDRLHGAEPRRAGEGALPRTSWRDRTGTGTRSSTIARCSTRTSLRALTASASSRATTAACGTKPATRWSSRSRRRTTRRAGSRRSWSPARSRLLWAALPAPRPSGRARSSTAAGRARQRAHAHRAGPARHAASELPRSAAAVPDRVVPAAGASGRRERETGWRDSTGGEGDHRRPRRGAGLARVDRRTQRSRGRDQDPWRRARDRSRALDQPPTFSVAVEGQTRDLHPIVRDEIYKIAAEALRNAFRHAHAGRVEVEIRYDDEQFRLRVRDDGKGIDPAVLAGQGIEGHYGLRGMPERAALIGGKLAVWSEAGAGTEVELSIPARAVYATAGARSWWSRLFASKMRAHVERDGS